MSETQEPKIEEQAEQALEAINSFEKKTEEIAKDNAELRSQMSEDETIALDKAKEIMESASGKDERQNLLPCVKLLLWLSLAKLSRVSILPIRSLVHSLHSRMPLVLISSLLKR